MLVWIESVSSSEFEVCLQESRVFDGLHEGLKVVSRYSVHVIVLPVIFFGVVLSYSLFMFFVCSCPGDDVVCYLLYLLVHFTFTISLLESDCILKICLSDNVYVILHRKVSV